MRKTITLLAAVAFFCGGLFTATGQLIPDPKAPYLPPEVLEETAEKIQRGAENGNPIQQYMLGFIYEDGQFGKTEDYKKAFEWYMKSAKQGYIDACSSLAICYLKGIGVEINLTEAYAWSLVAKAEGDEAGRRIAEAIKTHAKDWKSYVEQAQARAKEIQKELKANKQAKEKKAEAQKKAEESAKKDEKDKKEREAQKKADSAISKPEGTITK